LSISAKVDTTLNVYKQVVDGSLRRAADTVGSELFTIVHKAEETRETPAEGGQRYRAKTVREQVTGEWLLGLDSNQQPSVNRRKKKR
jgi:hypothetical protein